MKKIIILIVIVIVIIAGYFIYQSISSLKETTETEATLCEVDADCIVFGQDGDCNCGCFNKNHDWEAEGDCFCAAPKSCKCLDGKCEGVFKEEETVDWETYRNEKYGFEVKYPGDWDIAEFSEIVSIPIFNIYKKNQSKTPPFDHFTNATHVSVFPQGIPTEGVAAQIITSDIEIKESTIHANDFILFNGDRWATYIKFQEIPENWNAAGFVWAAEQINDHYATCEREGEEIDREQCDLFEGDQLIYHGTISKQDREIVKTILSTFKFLD